MIFFRKWWQCIKCAFLHFALRLKFSWSVACFPSLDKKKHFLHNVVNLFLPLQTQTSVVSFRVLASWQRTRRRITWASPRSKVKPNCYWLHCGSVCNYLPKCWKTKGPVVIMATCVFSLSLSSLLAVCKLMSPLTHHNQFKTNVAGLFFESLWHLTFSES